MTSMYTPKGLKLPRLQHASLPITDGMQDAARAFYAGILGLTEKPVPDALAGNGLVWFVAGDNAMELHLIPDTYLAAREEGRHICFEVEDLEGYRHALQEAGYEIIEASVIPHRPRFFCLDPCGNHIELTTIEADYLGADR